MVGDFKKIARKDRRWSRIGEVVAFVGGVGALTVIGRTRERDGSTFGLARWLRWRPVRQEWIQNQVATLEY